MEKVKTGIHKVISDILKQNVIYIFNLAYKVLSFTIVKLVQNNYDAYHPDTT